MEQVCLLDVRLIQAHVCQQGATVMAIADRSRVADTLAMKQCKNATLYSAV